MDIQVHAVVLLLLPLATLAWCRRWRGRPVPAKGAAVGVVVAVLTMLAAIVVNTHACNEGVPVTQWLIGGTCVGCVIALTPAAHWRWALGGLLIVVTQVLALHFTDVVHRSGLTGNPSWNGVDEIVLRSTRRQLAELARAAPPDATLPAGWLRELDVSAMLGRDVGTVLLPREPQCRNVGRFWHSWLTGIYPWTGVPQDYWYPGGHVREALARIELRNRVHEVHGG